MGAGELGVVELVGHCRLETVWRKENSVMTKIPLTETKNEYVIRTVERIEPSSPGQPWLHGRLRNQVALYHQTSVVEKRTKAQTKLVQAGVIRILTV